MSVVLVYITDNVYVLPTVVSISSAIQNKNPETIYDIYVIGYHLSQGLEEAFPLLNTENVRIHYLAYKEDPVLEKIKPDIYVTSTALLKFKIADLLPNVDKAIYIDGDTLVQKDLTQMYEIALEDKAIGAVKDYACVELFHDNLNLPTYFNSGILLMNLALWRKKDFGTQLMELKKERPELKYMDQDAFNMFFQDNYKKLPVIYNAMMPNFRGYSVPMSNLNAFYDSHFSDYQNILENAVIIHLTNSYKPWLFKGVYLSDLWMSYLQKSPFRDIQLSLAEPK